jgi:transcriptional regulator with XRE-family HTH domain
MYPNLKLQLWKMGVRQNSLAKSLGMDETVLSKIVNGYRRPRARVRKQIAAMLDSDESWLFEAIEVKPAVNGNINLGRTATPGTERKS